MALPGTIEMLETLVSEPSVSCTDADIDRSNVAVIEHLANWLDDLSFQVEVVPLPDVPGKANLIARRGGTAPDGLVLAGHTDTVPCDPHLWDVDPFAITEKSDSFYGLGTCDMKGFFPLALNAVAAFEGETLTKPLTVVATCDEETSMDGARYLESKGFLKARAAVIGEPTDMRPIRAHKGIMMLSIQIEGASGHSSNPALGKNAIEAMNRVISRLIDFREALAERHQHLDFEVAVPTLNFGCLHGGDNPNRICGSAELQIDLRTLPGMDSATILGELSDEVLAAASDFPTTVTPLMKPVSAHETDADGHLVRTLERLTGKSSGVVAFGTEAPFFDALGMETVVFGAGSIDQAHQPNEFLPAAQIEPMQRALTALVDHYCR